MAVFERSYSSWRLLLYLSDMGLANVYYFSIPIVITITVTIAITTITMIMIITMIITTMITTTTLPLTQLPLWNRMNSRQKEEVSQEQRWEENNVLPPAKEKVIPKL